MSETTLEEENFQINVEKVIDSLTEVDGYIRSAFKKMAEASISNTQILCEFIASEYREQNLRLSSRQSHIKIMYLFDRFLNHKEFRQVSKGDILDYLGSLKKNGHSYKWINTYNTRQTLLKKFFRWLYNRTEPDGEKWITPLCINGIRPLARKEKSSYKPDDLWNDEEHSIFLKYCPEKRDRCYHSMANDTSARPHELLSIKLGDLRFKTSSTGRQYAEIHIEESKTRPRTLPLIFSLPYVKDWLDDHPMSSNPQAYLFISLADSNFGAQLTENALYKVYTRHYKGRYFRRLLKDPAVPEADKSYIRNMITKPWNPYLHRHSALTKKSQILKESVLRDHAGWSMTSRMPDLYLHYFGNESSKSLLEAYGIEDYHQKRVDLLKSTYCPNCNESNKAQSKFCSKCRMVLTIDAYNETLLKDREKELEMKVMQEKMSAIEESQKEIADLLKEPSKLMAILSQK